MLSHIFLKTTTYHRFKHCWTAEEKEHHLNPKRDLKIFFSYQSAHLVCRSQREQVETCKHWRWCCWRIHLRFHLSSPADAEREPAELWQPKKEEEKNWSDWYSVPFRQITGLSKAGLSSGTDSAWGRDLTKHTTSKQLRVSSLHWGGTRPCLQGQWSRWHIDGCHRPSSLPVNVSRVCG